MDGSSEAYGVIHLVYGAAVIASKKITLNGLARTSDARPERIRPNLDVEGSGGRIGKIGSGGVHELLIAEAGAVYEPSMVPIESEHRCGDVELIAKIRQAIRRADAVRVVVS